MFSLGQAEIELQAEEIIEKKKNAIEAIIALLAHDESNQDEPIDDSDDKASIESPPYVEDSDLNIDDNLESDDSFSDTIDDTADLTDHDVETDDDETMQKWELEKWKENKKLVQSIDSKKIQECLSLVQYYDDDYASAIVKIVTDRLEIEGTYIQRPDQYKMKILVLSIQYDFQILKYQYQYSI